MSIHLPRLQSHLLSPHIGLVTSHQFYRLDQILRDRGPSTPQVSCQEPPSMVSPTCISLAWVTLFIAPLCSVTHNVPAYLHLSHLSLTPKVGSPHRGGAPELDKMLSGATIHPVTLGICLQCPKVFRNCFLFFTSLFHLIKNSSTLGNFVSSQICTMHDTL